MKKRTVLKLSHASGSRFCHLAGIFLTAACLTACGGTSKASQVTVAETAAAMGAAAPKAAPMESAAFDMEYAEYAKEADAGFGQDFPSPAGEMTPPTTTRKLIRTIDLHVETTEFDALLSSVSRSVTELGGYLESSDIYGSSLANTAPSSRSAFLTARIPADRLDTFLEQVDSQGNVTNRTSNTQDVTLQYSDVESRKKSLSIEQERLWALLEKADSLDAVIALESRLSEIRYQLESLESQLRTYDNQVDYSTVHLALEEVSAFTPTSPDSVLVRMQKGFAKNGKNVKNGLVNAAVWFVATLPVLLVLAVLLALLLLLARAFTSLRARKIQRRAARSVSAPLTDEASTPSYDEADKSTPSAHEEET